MKCQLRFANCTSAASSDHGVIFVLKASVVLLVGFSAERHVRHGEFGRPLVGKTKRKMSATRTFKRLRMASTHGFVSVARVAIDATNAFVNRAIGPARRRWKALVGDAPWFGVASGALLIQYIPTSFVPTLSNIFLIDSRRELEEQRIRHEIQQGNDPFPYLKHRDMTYGATHHHKESRTEFYPREACPENVSIDAFRRKRAENQQRDLGALDKHIEALEKEVGGKITLEDAWLRDGIYSGENPLTAKTTPLKVSYQ